MSAQLQADYLREVEQPALRAARVKALVDSLPSRLQSQALAFVEQEELREAALIRGEAQASDVDASTRSARQPVRL